MVLAMNKRSAIFLTSYQHHWLKEISYNFSKYFDIEYFCNPLTPKDDSQEENYIEKINLLCKKYDVVFYHYEFAWEGLGKYLHRIEHKKIVVLFFDDIPFHEKNLHDLEGAKFECILSASPLSVLKYRTFGYRAYFMPLEGSNEKYFPASSQIDRYDFFFSGSDRAGRKDFIDVLGRLATQAGYKAFLSLEKQLSLNEYLAALRASKIVVNLSQNCDSGRTQFQFKGRILEAAFSGSYCISEYCPEAEIIFPNGSLLFFRTPQEMEKLLWNFLSDANRLSKYTQAFFEFSKRYRPQVVMDRLIQLEAI
jgi:hypothetical protein